MTGICIWGAPVCARHGSANEVHDYACKVDVCKDHDVKFPEEAKLSKAPLGLAVCLGRLLEVAAVS